MPICVYLRPSIAHIPLQVRASAPKTSYCFAVIARSPEKMCWNDRRPQQHKSRIYTAGNITPLVCVYGHSCKLDSLLNRGRFKVVLVLSIKSTACLEVCVLNFMEKSNTQSDYLFSI